MTTVIFRRPGLMKWPPLHSSAYCPSTPKWDFLKFNKLTKFVPSVTKSTSENFFLLIRSYSLCVLSYTPLYKSNTLTDTCNIHMIAALLHTVPALRPYAMIGNPNKSKFYRKSKMFQKSKQFENPIYLSENLIFYSHLFIIFYCFDTSGSMIPLFLWRARAEQRNWIF